MDEDGLRRKVFEQGRLVHAQKLKIYRLSTKHLAQFGYREIIGFIILKLRIDLSNLLYGKQR